ncbi:hypothetical protein PCL_08989 [Purpureocillium lilacinum]|uniref:Uncharacterized protein n=1 Tax=Purpureocillium lilacinum TaxID=33203 RepID=A0A2U3EGV3_PURLI|nr:hypothetical protein PCL_08989 [Purpureocillium lilacinum]
MARVAISMVAQRGTTLRDPASSVVLLRTSADATALFPGSRAAFRVSSLLLSKDSTPENWRRGPIMTWVTALDAYLAPDVTSGPFGCAASRLLNASGSWPPAISPREDRGSACWAMEISDARHPVPPRSAALAYCYYYHACPLLRARRHGPLGRHACVRCSGRGGRCLDVAYASDELVRAVTVERVASRLPLRGVDTPGRLPPKTGQSHGDICLPGPLMGSGTAQSQIGSLD